MYFNNVVRSICLPSYWINTEDQSGCPVTGQFDFKRLEHNDSETIVSLVLSSLLSTIYKFVDISNVSMFIALAKLVIIGAVDSV